MTHYFKAELVGNNRLSRLEIERYLRNKSGRDVVSMTGAEATGYGEMCYGKRGGGGGVCVCRL